MLFPRSLTRDEVRDVDRRAIQEYGLPGIVLMENAGRNTAALLRAQPITGPVVVCCGGGNNGGDGYVIARHLDLAGVEVRILAVVPPDRLTGDAAVNAAVITRSGLPLRVLNATDATRNARQELEDADWIVDALLGTGTTGAVRSPYAEVITEINAAPGRVLAVDLPSGLDCDTGTPLGPCIEAELTATFVARKRGFDQPSAQPYLGAVHVLDIGAPRRLIEDCLRPASTAFPE